MQQKLKKLTNLRILKFYISLKNSQTQLKLKINFTV